MGEIDQLLERQIAQLRIEMNRRFDDLSVQLGNYASKDSVRYLTYFVFFLALVILTLHGFGGVIKAITEVLL